ncbi:MAG: hypothetical protein IPL78_00785 [Chloroflexi bacterium]|nr:hypothetical protein [Chloroflexota bacterium]
MGPTANRTARPRLRRQIRLRSAGWCTLTVANSGLSGSDACTVQWRVAAPSGPNTGTPYVYYTDAFRFTGVALSADHVIEPLLLDAGALTWDTLATDTTRGWLYFYDLNANSPFPLRPVRHEPASGHHRRQPGRGGHRTPCRRWRWMKPAAASTGYNPPARPPVPPPFIMPEQRGWYGHGAGGRQWPQPRLSWVDPIKGVLYWKENDTIRRSDLDGSRVTTLYTATSGNQVVDLALDPYSQKLYWLDPNQQTLFRANSDGTGITAIVTGLAAGARGVALQPLDNALYYSNCTDMMPGAVGWFKPAAIASLSGTYLGPSNLNPGTYLNTPIGTPGSSLAFGYNTPIVSPCALADIHEPNNDSGTATPLTVITQTDATGALCNTVIPNPTDMDYYHVTLADQKVLTATLTNLPADYRLVIIHPNGYAARSVTTPVSPMNWVSSATPAARRSSGHPGDERYAGAKLRPIPATSPWATCHPRPTPAIQTATTPTLRRPRSGW